MNNLQAEHVSTDQNWADETTIYWFRVTGTHDGTGCEIDGVYGVSQCNDDRAVIVDADGCPLTRGDSREVAVRSVCLVTEEVERAGHWWVC